MSLVRAIGSGDVDGSERMVRAAPELALASVETGATRQEAVSYYLEGISHYVYAGDTALHIAAASHRPDLVKMLLGVGASVSARNRRGAQPLHYAADGHPGFDRWDPSGQAAVIEALVAAG